MLATFVFKPTKKLVCYVSDICNSEKTTLSIGKQYQVVSKVVYCMYKHP